jgi:hypothetical protein
VPFAASDSLDQLRAKIARNGYSFTVKDTWVYNLSPEEKARMFPARVAPPVEQRHLVPRSALRLGADLRGAALAFDWRDQAGRSYVGPIRNQGNLGSCYAFAACAAAETTYNVANGLHGNACIDVSESYVVWTLSSVYPYSDHFGGGNGADYEYYELHALTWVGPPEGLTASFTRDSDTRITFSLTGNAADHDDAGSVAGFSRNPRIWGEYLDPPWKALLERKPKKATATAIGKVAPPGAANAYAEWKKAACLFQPQGTIESSNWICRQTRLDLGSMMK